MKKALITLMLTSILTLVGCGAQGTSQTAKETTLQTTTEKVYVDYDDVIDFDNYEALMNEYNKGRSANYVFPLPEIVDTWELTAASLCASNYTLYYTDVANEVDIMLEIGYTSTYQKISDYFDSIAYSYGDASVIEMTDRYAVRCYSDPVSYAIIGITGEENIRYTLVVGGNDETVDPVDLLKEYKDILEL